MHTGRVVFDGVWKKFRRGERHDSLRDLIPALACRLVRRRPADALAGEEFWAVRDVSFEVKPGEALGIIGANGAGKSTTLKLLSRILRPTRGRAEVCGRVGALIEVAAGFHPDLTGRENVFLQGAIMGMKRQEIRRAFDRIVDFAGVGEFIDTPVKRYSSGMNARLGFAIAAHLDPDVLLIDEVLSVGDMAFQERCVARMRELLGRGVPLVFVSHNLSAVQDLCTRAIVLKQGRAVFDGEPAAAILAYRRAPAAGADLAQAGTQPIRITGVQLVGSERGSVFRTGASLTVRIHYEAVQPIDNPHFGVDFIRADGVYCAGINTNMDHRDAGRIQGRGQVDLIIPQLWLLPGSYMLTIGILEAHTLGTLDVQHGACALSVVSSRHDYGIVYLEHEWRHHVLDQPRAAAVTGAPDREPQHAAPRDSEAAR
jgi:lipopolysaccharide transport system ATP-binding protein